MSRARALETAERVVIKIGSSSLTRQDGGLDRDRITAIASLVSDLRQRGKLVVVVSSGSIAAGISPLSMKRRPRDLSGQQAAAAVGQGMLILQSTRTTRWRLLRFGLVTTIGSPRWWPTWCGRTFLPFSPTLRPCTPRTPARPTHRGSPRSETLIRSAQTPHTVARTSVAAAWPASWTRPTSPPLAARQC
ncbi:MAG: hypothetical protein CSA63_02260 [Propionibacterium sp.]|nr:MAG: hypothetical protein CSA63_02260 [Propionibacterium sp.]